MRNFSASGPKQDITNTLLQAFIFRERMGLMTCLTPYCYGPLATVFCPRGNRSAPGLKVNVSHISTRLLLKQNLTPENLSKTRSNWHKELFFYAYLEISQRRETETTQYSAQQLRNGNTAKIPRPLVSLQVYPAIVRETLQRMLSSQASYNYLQIRFPILRALIPLFSILFNFSNE
ncbi:predicted protein [Uncinocarpus reesii 1704]|uniref:Uncharacterized protein n=1 Tax=Uncinocarpus reesii (strain UAMH 1704) TaxID=336963 RepID=C4JUL3_UNCRE|nr:uncharacterized protein UREG_04816 [Uncinocarpus reesii 1704]EEP79974.1 predicted protein [Uncinocarpus reesii 1704]